MQIAVLMYSKGEWSMLVLQNLKREVSNTCLISYERMNLFNDFHCSPPPIFFSYLWKRWIWDDRYHFMTTWVSSLFFLVVLMLVHFFIFYVLTHLSFLSPPWGILAMKNVQEVIANKVKYQPKDYLGTSVQYSEHFI